MKFIRYKSILVLLTLIVFGASCSRTIQNKDDILQQAEQIREAHAMEVARQVEPIVTPVQETSEISTTPPLDIQSHQNTITVPFENERLVYQVKFMGMVVGEMVNSFKERSLYKGRPVFIFESTARTASFFAKVFKIENRLISYMDAEKFRVLYFEETRREGKYRKDAVVEFDYDAGKAYFYNDEDKTRKVIDIPDQVHDILTANYYARLIPWNVGDTHEFKIYNSEKIYDYIGMVKDQKRIKTKNLGKRLSYILQPYAFVEGEKVKKGKITAFFDAGPSRVPLQGFVKTPIFGSAAFHLYKINNEKF